MTSLKTQIVEAIKQGLNASPTRSTGCGRAYVCMLKVDAKTLNAYKSAATELGIRYLKEAYGAGDRALYLGYDNNTGKELGRAMAIADNLRALGLPVYFDAVGD